MQTDLLKNKTILITEDDKFSLLLIEEFLKETEAKILTAKNGEEAVETFKKNPTIDLILMDFKLPIMNGYDAAIEIKKINKDIPIIVQTANILSKEYKNVNLSIFNDYIFKPFKKEELYSKIYELLFN